MPAERVFAAPLRSAAFRFALMLALIFAAGAAVLLMTVQKQVGDYATEATNGRIVAEAEILIGEYRQLGQSGLTDAMARHQSVGDDAPFRYRLLDRQGRRLFGDLPAPSSATGWGSVRVAETSDDGDSFYENIPALTKQLPDSLMLTVATDNFDIQDMRARLSRFTLLSGVGITLFALIGGFLTGRVFLRRLNAVNRTLNGIIDADTTERLPMIGFGPEFDELAHNVNRMLDRNAASMKALRQVSEDIAHDLRTPLTRLYASLEEMQAADATDPALIDDALSQTSGLLDTFQALLRIGTVEGGIGRKRFQPVNLSELLDRIHLAYQPVAEDNGQILRADHRGGIVVSGDESLLAQMFTNLIENAIVHTPAGTIITTRLAILNGVPIAEVSDTGPGVPSDEQHNIFRRFYRLDASRNTQGSGLGLALVAAIAALHNAETSVAGDDGLSIGIAFLADRGTA